MWQADVLLAEFAMGKSGLKFNALLSRNNLQLTFAFLHVHNNSGSNHGGNTYTSSGVRQP